MRELAPVARGRIMQPKKSLLEVLCRNIIRGFLRISYLLTWPWGRGDRLKVVWQPAALLEVIGALGTLGVDETIPTIGE